VFSPTFVAVCPAIKTTVSSANVFVLLNVNLITSPFFTLVFPFADIVTSLTTGFNINFAYSVSNISNFASKSLFIFASFASSAFFSASSIAAFKSPL